jgi:hypothetical protein
VAAAEAHVAAGVGDREAREGGIGLDLGAQRLDRRGRGLLSWMKRLMRAAGAGSARLASSWRSSAGSGS